MSKLKKLCIDNTAISLKHFIKEIRNNDIEGLEKLGIVGLDKFSNDDYLRILEKISKRFPKL